MRWPQALIQDSQAVPCEELRLGDLVILSRPAVARGERIGGGPLHHARLTELERLAGPSAPRLVMPHPVPNLIPRLKERAEQRHYTRRSPTTSRNHTSGSVNSLEIGSEVSLGTNRPTIPINFKNHAL